MSEYSLQADSSTGKKYHDALLYRQTTDATVTELTTDGATEGSTNRFFIGSGSAFFCRVNVIARETAGTDFKSFMRFLIIENTAGTTALVGAVTTLGSDLASGGAGAWTVTITADDTNDSLTIDVTGVAATTINWVAKIDAVETD